LIPETPIIGPDPKMMIASTITGRIHEDGTIFAKTGHIYEHQPFSG